MILNLYPECLYRGRRRACRGPASTSPARSSGWTSSSSRCTPWRSFDLVTPPYRNDRFYCSWLVYLLRDGVGRCASSGPVTCLAASRMRARMRVSGRGDGVCVAPYAIDATYVYLLNPSPPSTAPAPPPPPPSPRGSPRPCRSRAANTRPRRRRRRPWPRALPVPRRSITRRRPPRAVLVMSRRR